LAKRIDYATKDYEGFKQDMLELIPQKLPEWTDRSDNDAGIVLLELLAYQLEKLSYYNDRVANEVFLSTATQRRSVINHCKLIGYELGWHKSARYQQVFEIEPQPEDTVIPSGFQVGTKSSAVEEPLIFETLEDLIIPAGATGLEKDEEGNYLYSVEIEHGQTVTDEFIGAITNSDPDQSFRLQYSPVLKESIEIEVEEPNGRYAWEMVSDFIASDQQSTHYLAEMDEYAQVFIGFGNGTSGKIPEQPARIYASYKVGGGIEGNIGANTIVEFYDSIPGLVNTFNPLGPSSLGEDMESIEMAKVNAPASLKKMERYVTLSDYEDGIKLDVPFVARAKAINNNGDVDFYLVSPQGTNLTTSQKDTVMEVVNQKKIMFTDVFIKDPTYVTVDVSVDIISYSNYDPETIKFTAKHTIEEMFEPTEVDFGKDVAIAGLHYKLMGIEGVRNINISLPVNDVPIADTEIPQLGTVTVTVNGK
jgi:uncharacterized phage protein gp47/JayE